jgi:hypothetical protein
LAEAMNASPAVRVARLHDAFAGRRCVSAWLGYAEVLFLGFGEKALAERGDDGRRVRPPFQLTTNFADWRVEGPRAAGSADSDRAQLEAAAESLVGERVESWELLDGERLRLTFSGGKLLTVVPWSAAEGIADAWCVKAPDGRILAAATNGRAVVVDARLPIRDWFGDVASEPIAPGTAPDRGST